MNALARGWDWYFYQGYSGLSLGALRALFGGGMLLYHITQFIMLLILDPLGAHTYFVEPIWYFKILNISTHVPWLNIPVFLLLMAATTFFMLGRWTKPAIIVTVLCIFYLKGVRDSFSGDVHHRYVVLVSILFLFYFSKCDYQFALDAKRKVNNKVKEWEASWPIRAAQAYIVMFYFWAMIAKLRVTGWTWLDKGGQIQAKLLERSLRSGFDEYGELVRRGFSFELAYMVELVWAIGILVVVFELAAPTVLIYRKRAILIVFLTGAFIFHTANFILLNVQFFMYPFVFFVFFNMAPFAIWFQRKYGAEKALAN